MTSALLIVAALAAPPTAAAEEAPSAEVRKIWDRANHNAFTDLIRFRDAWFCTFRESSSHVAPDGALRVITSPDGREWTSAALIASASADLRDPKLSLTPDGRLLLVGVSVTREGGKASYQSMAWTSDDGRHWGEGRKVGDRDVWLWRAAWHDGAAYGVGYSTSKDKFTRLYKGDAGHFEPIVSPLFDRGYPNEAALAFQPDGSGLCLLRRDGKGGETSAQLGRSSAPYTSWTWKDLGKQVGGPGLVILPDGRIVAGVRLYDKKVRTSLCWLDPEAGALTEFLTLPSGGDTSYPGLVWHDDRLWVSYYSSHEGKTSIYVAKVKLPAR